MIAELGGQGVGGLPQRLEEIAPAIALFIFAANRVLGAGFPVVIQHGEITYYVRREHLFTVMEALRDEPALRFEFFSGVSGVHYPDRPPVVPGQGPPTDWPIPEDEPPLAMDKVRYQGEPVAAVIAESEAFGYLDAPIVRLAGRDMPIPYNRTLEYNAVPQVEHIVAKARDIVQGKV